MDIDEIRSKAKRNGLKAGGIWVILCLLPLVIIFFMYPNPERFLHALLQPFEGTGILAILLGGCPLGGVFIIITILAFALFYSLAYYGTKKKLMEHEKTREDNELREKMMEFLDKQNQTNK